MDDNAAREVAQRLKVLGERYASQFPERTAEIQSLWHQVESDEKDQDSLQALYRLVHGLSGSGATFGFPRLSEAAQQCERALRAGIDTGHLSLDTVRLQIGCVLAELDR